MEQTHALQPLLDGRRKREKGAWERFGWGGHHRSSAASSCAAAECTTATRNISRLISLLHAPLVAVIWSTRSPNPAPANRGDFYCCGGGEEGRGGGGDKKGEGAGGSSFQNLHAMVAGVSHDDAPVTVDGDAAPRAAEFSVA